MLRTVYSKLALALLIVFFVIAAIIIGCIWMMIDREEVFELLLWIVIGGFGCALATGLLAFGLFTRRLSALADAVEAFRSGNFDQPIRLRSAQAHGDEIGRLGFAFEQMARRITDQLQSLKDIDGQRRELLANVSHDLRTPLASMRGYLETLLLKEGSLTREESRNYLEVAARQAERLSKLVADLFELTKLEAQEVGLNREGFPITELVQDVVQKFDLASTHRGIRVESDFAESLPQVYADISLIERVLDNLIENALRHCAKGSIVRVGLVRAGERVTVKVCDTGVGIAPAELPYIFERFYQGSRTSGTGGGAGLGLAITKRILALHGSDIRVESTLGAGTTFYFDLAAAATH